MVASSLLSPKKTYVLRLSPPWVMAIAYMLSIAVGTMLLMLPQASYKGTAFFDALFTACASVTVSGLMVLDIGSHFTWFGQFIILGLIQLGGLGIMAFAVLIMAMLGVRIPAGKQLLLRENLNQTDIFSLMRLVWIIFRFVLVLEIVGALFLATHFIPAFGWAKGSWLAVFHAVSAFNNSGISLFSSSLMFWVEDGLVNLVIPALFITGGIGYAVLADIREKKNWHKLNLHSKLMLAGTAGLIVWGMAAFAILEWSNPATLGRIDSEGGRLMAAWFQSVTTRTAGFNTVNIGAIHDATAFMMMPLMLIGGGGASTAGGIKVTTFIVMLLAVIAFFKQRDHLQAFGRSMGMEQVLKAMAIITLSLLVVLCGLFAITLTNHELSFLDLAFEISAAFSTTGLSRGITPELDSFGRIVLMVVMGIGRVGPLALSFFLATRVRSRVRYPSSEVFLG